MNLIVDKTNFIQNKQLGAKYTQAVPAGIYSLKDFGGMGNTIYGFVPAESGERIVEFSDGTIGDMMSIIPRFFDQQTISGYEEMGIVHKMGLLMYGPPGTGKTITARMLMKRLASDYGAVCLLATGKHPDFVKGAVQYLRSIQTAPIVIFYDEFDYVVEHCEEDLLTFLDGQDSVAGTILIGCTNYLDKIPERIKSRKSRIKHVVEIKALPMSVYKTFITEKLPSMESSLQTELAFKAEAEGLTLDQVKHVMIDYRIESIPFDEAIKSVKVND